MEGVAAGAGVLGVVADAVVVGAVVKPSKILPLIIFPEPIPEPLVWDIRFKLGSI